MKRLWLKAIIFSVSLIIWAISFGPLATYFRWKPAVLSGASVYVNDHKSARYILLPRIEGSYYYCGLVNSIDMYGQYVGYRPFRVIMPTPKPFKRWKANIDRLSRADTEDEITAVTKKCEVAGYDLEPLLKTYNPIHNEIT